MFQDVGGWRSVKRISTIDLMPLKPYFHGVISRSGAPFWFGSTLPYSPTASIASGFMASSMRRHSTYGHSSTGYRWPGISAGRITVLNATYFAFDVGLKRLSTSASGIPIHGITIDHASTQRRR